MTRGKSASEPCGAWSRSDERLAAILARTILELEARLARLRLAHARRLVLCAELFDRAVDGVILLDDRPGAAASARVSPSARGMLGLEPEEAPAAWRSRLRRADGTALTPGDAPWERALLGEKVNAVPLSARGHPVLASARRTPRGAIVVLSDARDEVAEAHVLERSIVELDGMRRRSRAELVVRRGRRCS